MTADAVIRSAGEPDVAAICLFGAEHIPPYYAPLIGASAADEQVSLWWNAEHIGAAVADGRVVVADHNGQLVGVGQRGRWESDHVIYKLYVHPRYRGSGLGPRLIAALVRQLPPDVDRIFVEHFAGNERAAGFYEREGFRVDHVEPHPSGERARAVVWRVRRLK